MSDITQNSPDCTASNCSHFVNKRNLVFYRYKYLAATFIGIIFILGWFWYANYCYERNISTIIDTHTSFYTDIEHRNKAIHPKDSTAQIFRQQLLMEVKDIQTSTNALLEAQYRKMQSEYNVLALWAAALMIIFLVFSIYSMFKVDEMQKQGRDTLDRLEGFSQKAKELSKEIDTKSKEQLTELENKAKEELNTIKTQSNEEIERLKEEITSTKSKFNDDVNEKTKEFENSINKYQTELKESTKSNNDLIKSLITVIQNSSSAGKETSDQESKGTNTNDSNNSDKDEQS